MVKMVKMESEITHSDRKGDWLRMLGLTMWIKKLISKTHRN